MSSYIVNDQTINTIIAGLKKHHLSGKYPRLPENLMSENEEGYKALGSSLYLMNVAAVNDRYPDTRKNMDNAPGQIDEAGKHLPYGYKRVLPPINIVLYKQIQCLLYQCSEGEVDTFPLYKALDKFYAILGHDIISNLPEYENAAWG